MFLIGFVCGMGAACLIFIVGVIEFYFRHKKAGTPSASHNTGSPKLPPDVEEFVCYLIDHCEGNTISEEYLVSIGPEYYKWRQLRAGA